jgi:hypothetical protein
MAAMEEVFDFCSRLLEQEHGVSDAYECYNCLKMKTYLKILIVELKSAQTVTKLLVDERNHVGRHNVDCARESVNTQDSHNMNVTNSENDGVWTEVRGNHTRNQQRHVSRNVKFNKERFPSEIPRGDKFSISVSNRFLPLLNGHGHQENHFGSSLNSKHKSDMEILKNNTPDRNIQHDRRDVWEQPIPTIINGVVDETGGEMYESKDYYHDRLNALSKSISENNTSGTNLLSKHKVILIGDSHIRGYAENITSVLSKKLEIFSLVKPGANSDELKVSAKNEIKDLTHTDLVIICYGSNDYERNEFPRTLTNISNFLQENNHTNILVMNVPFRHDLLNGNSVNYSIISLNRKIKRVTKAFQHSRFINIDNNRHLFTNHGLHRNKLGKQLAVYTLASTVQSLLEKKVHCPIVLEWQNQLQDDSISVSEEKVKQATTRSLSRKKRIPVTRSDDFLWET